MSVSIQSFVSDNARVGTRFHDRAISERTGRIGALRTGILAES
jgi:hypothetical protein